MISKRFMKGCLVLIKQQTAVCWEFEGKIVVQSFVGFMFVHYAKFRLIVAAMGFFFPT